MDNIYNKDTICAISTPNGVGAIAVIRMSGNSSIEVLSSIFKPLKGISLSDTKSHSLRYGTIYNDDQVIDEVMVSIFRGTHSFTGEESAEIYCHGSIFVQNEIIMLLISKGSRLAKPGEFSQRAFLNGKMDLAQAEAVADLIASETAASHKIAIQQMRGGFSVELTEMRKALLDLVSLMELELDFSDEDVEFADRTKLNSLLNGSVNHISSLIDSFKLGNVIKNGVPVAIVGATNTGKSTLLNALLGEERAIVSDIHGTTRDFIEDVVNIDGVAFRFVDTAGIRKTREEIEIIGIERTYEKIKSASIVVLMLDCERPESFMDALIGLRQKANEGQDLVVVLNKTDLLPDNRIASYKSEVLRDLLSVGIHAIDVVPISAKSKIGINELKSLLSANQKNMQVTYNMTLVSNLRHYEALMLANGALNRVQEGIRDELPTDLLTQDIREALFHIGEIVGEVNTEEILGNIFSKFCIGK